jgi:hypothetical protein
MPDEECYRRITDFNSLETRVRLLEEAKLHLCEVQNHHESVIDKLELDSHELVIAVRLMAQSLNDFKESFKIGFKITSIALSAFIFIVGVFLKYSHDLDEKYLPKLANLVHTSKKQNELSAESYDSIQELIKEHSKTMKNKPTD